MIWEQTNVKGIQIQIATFFFPFSIVNEHFNDVCRDDHKCYISFVVHVFIENALKKLLKLNSFCIKEEARTIKKKQNKTKLKQFQY